MMADRSPLLTRAQKTRLAQGYNPFAVRDAMLAEIDTIRAGIAVAQLRLDQLSIHLAGLHMFEGSMRGVVRAVAEEAGIDPHVLIGPSKRADIVQVRDMAAWLIHTQLGRSNAQIGHVLGDRDPSTVLLSLRRARRHEASDPGWRNAASRIVQRMRMPDRSAPAQAVAHA